MDKGGPALHVLIFYWCVLLIDVTSLRLGRAVDRAFARRRQYHRRHRAEPSPEEHADRRFAALQEATGLDKARCAS